jgi:ketosteroid isomerase-like protein
MPANDDQWSMNMDQQNLQVCKEMVKTVVREIHEAIEHKDALRLGELVVPDVFIFGSAAEAVSIGRDQFVSHLCNDFAQTGEAILRVQSPQIEVGLCESGESAWFLDRFVIDVMGGQEIPQGLPVRLTGLLVHEPDWRLAAGYWSIPVRDNDTQHTLLEDGKIRAGLALESQVSNEAQTLAQSLVAVMAEPACMPELYSRREDAYTIGSTVDEVFHAAEGRSWVQEIVQLPLGFAIRGGMRGAVAPDGCTAWMATHVDLSGGLTVPYRFFYVWLHEQNGWKIVISHDGVSIDPFNPGFDIP